MLDVIVAVVGFARLISASSLTEEDWQLHRALNLGYVRQAYRVLENNLRRSGDPRFATLGSRWSLRSDNDYLLPYIAAKHELRAWTRELASNNQWLKANHYCVPTMVTPQQIKLVEEAASAGYGEMLTKGSFHTSTDYHEVANLLTSLILGSERSGQTYIMSKEGVVTLLPVTERGR